MSRLPRTLKMMNVFVNGESFAGEAQTVTLPPLTRKVESMTLNTGFDVELDMGNEVLVLGHKYAGRVPPEILAGYGAPGLGSQMVRFAGGYQDQDTGANELHEIVVRGSHKEITPGDQKVGAVGEGEAQTTCTYYKHTVDGVVVIEIDMLTGLFLVNGVDRTAELRQFVGL